MEELLRAKIEELEHAIARLLLMQASMWENDRPEQDSVAQENRAGMRQAIDGANEQLALYRKQLAQLN